MCRILAISSAGEIPESVPLSFRFLADTGRTPYGTREETLRQHQQPGHRGGWGIAVSRGGSWQGTPRISDVDRVVGLGDASANGSGFAEAIDVFDLSGPGVLVAHLRRPSRSEICNRNTHPFQEGRYVFCHNGAVPWLKEEDRDAETEIQRNDTRGLFRRILTRVHDEQSVNEALLATIAEVHARDRQVPEERKYTSLTSVLSDGQDVWVVRDVNLARANPNTEYFTMFLATSTSVPGLAIACQEPIQPGGPLRPLDWEPMSPRELVLLRNGVVIRREPIPA